MDFNDVFGLDHLKKHLITTLKQGRIAHAQLFIGQSGSGVLPLAIAYAKEVLCMSYEKGSEAYSRCEKNVAQLNHPDLHFVYPITANEQVKNNPISSLFAEDWHNFITQNPYSSLYQWYQHLGIDNKQGNINVKEAEAIGKKMALKSFEGGYKIMIIWMAEKMNTECANKILKLIEEPPKNSLLLLISENEEQIISTVHSRCQKLHVPLLSDDVIAKALKNTGGYSDNEYIKASIRAQGDYNKALQLLTNSSKDQAYETWFIQWVRTAFKAKGNKNAINQLLIWSQEMAGTGRETQKGFLQYCIELFRQALLKSYKVDQLLFFESSDEKFDLEKFAPFVHQNNIFEIVEALENASYHVERNGNPKIIFTDLSIQLTRLIHKKEAV